MLQLGSYSLPLASSHFIPQSVELDYIICLVSWILCSSCEKVFLKSTDKWILQNNISFMEDPWWKNGEQGMQKV